MPEQGEELLGVVTDFQPSVPTRFKPVPVVTIRDPHGIDHSVWLTHAVLRREFARQRVELGETVLIRYQGKVRPDGGGDEYASYKLVVDRPRPAAGIDWDAIAARHEDDLGDVDDQAEPAGTFASAPAASTACAECGYLDGDHAVECSNTIPF